MSRRRAAHVDQHAFALDDRPKALDKASAKAAAAVGVEARPARAEKQQPKTSARALQDLLVELAFEPPPCSKCGAPREVVQFHSQKKKVDGSWQIARTTLTKKTCACPTSTNPV